MHVTLICIFVRVRMFHLIVEKVLSKSALFICRVLRVENGGGQKVSRKHAAHLERKRERMQRAQEAAA